MPVLPIEQWNQFTEDRDCSLLQSASWGELKSGFGWAPIFIQSGNAGAMVLFRSLPLGFTIGYIPRGPVGSDFPPLWEEIHKVCKAHNAVFLRVEPNFRENSAEANDLLQTMKGFQPAFATVQPPNTILISLDGTEDDWLRRMNEKTRYNIRLSQRKGLILKESTDTSAFYSLMRQTGTRDSFGVHTESYYKKCLECFSADSKARILMAFYQDEPIAAIMLFIYKNYGYYLYGASSNKERNRMPNHFLQWRAMKICKENGCQYYDLWGIPDEPETVLEAEFQHRQDGLWQVYRFKRGFGGEVSRACGSFDYVYQPLIYRLIASYTRMRRK